MRISDWSSDVCSSDLTAAVAKSHVKPAATPKHAPPPPKPRAPSKRVVRAVGVQLNEDDIRDLSENEYMDDAQLGFFCPRQQHMRRDEIRSATWREHGLP